MGDLPILFSGPMVRALLAGTKTQTRRTFNPQPTMHAAGDCTVNGHRGSIDYLMRQIAPKHWLRITAGDRLYVREHWRTFVSLDGVPPRDLLNDGKRGAGVLYIADGSGMALTAGGDRTYGERDDAKAFGKHRQAMHMPRWASRITLTVTDVRVERLQEIDGEDALAEGIERPPAHTEDVNLWARMEYAKIWDTINGRDAWEANPWVAAYSFEVALGNIDTLARAS